MTNDPGPDPTSRPDRATMRAAAVALIAFGLSLTVGFVVGTWRSAAPAPGAGGAAAARSAPTVGDAIPVVEPAGSPEPAVGSDAPASSAAASGADAPSPSAMTVTRVSVPPDPAAVTVDGSDTTYSGASAAARAALDSAGIALPDLTSAGTVPPFHIRLPETPSGSTPATGPSSGANPYLVGDSTGDPTVLHFEDLCAGSSVGSGAACPDGVSGAILPEGWAVPDPPMEISHASYTADHPLTADCAGSRRSFPGQAVLEVVTDNPGTFVVSGDVQATVSTPDVETQRWRDEPGRRAPITTCVAVSHPPSTIDVRVTATDVNGSVATELLSLPLAGASARPPISVAPVGATRLRIALPVTHQEQTALVVQDIDDGVGANPCRSTHATPTPAQVQRLPFDAGSLAGAYDRSFDEVSVTTIDAPATARDLCVLAVRTESVGVTYISFAQSYRISPPSTYGITAEITDVKPTRGPPPSGPLTVDVARGPGVPSCTVTDDASALAGHGSGAHDGSASWGGRPLCELRSGETDGLVKLRATYAGRHFEVSAPVPARACVSLPAGGSYCPTAPVDQLVAVPIDGDANVYVHLHLDRSNGTRGAWDVGPAHDRLDQLGTDPGPPAPSDRPRLDLVNTRVVAAQGRAGESQLDVRWNTDRPVHVTAWVDDYDHATCSRPPDAQDADSGVGHDWRVADGLHDQGTISLHGLCAGTSYRIALSVQDGPGNVSEYISARPGVRRDGDAVEGTTDQTEVMYATKVTVREVPASWHGRYIRVRTVTGGSEGRTDWRWTWSNPPPLLHPPASDWSYDTACAAVDDLFDQRPDHIVEYGTGARSGVISVPGQPSTPIGGLEHRASQSLAKWPEDVDLDVGVQAWLSSTSCGDLVSQDQVDHASPSDFVWTNAFRGHGRITPADRAPGTWVDGDAQALDVRSPSTPGLVLQVRVVATRADHADR